MKKKKKMAPKRAAKKKTRKAPKIPNLVSGYYLVVSSAGTDVLATTKDLMPWEAAGAKPPAAIYPTKEAAQTELDELRGLTVSLPEEETFKSARIVPAKEFLANHYSFDLNSMTLDCQAVRNDTPVVSWRRALKLSRKQVQDLVRNANAILKETLKDQAEELRDFKQHQAQNLKTAQTEVRECRAMAERLFAKAAQYDA